MRITKAMIERGAKALNTYGGWDGPDAKRCMHGAEPVKCSVCAALRAMDRDKACTVLVAVLAPRRNAARRSSEGGA